uniref:Uncharacterized protein n=1 Tax=Klebsormidium flaccidum TaxID=3175 RepID=A0A0B5GWJ4_KLEFL|nr:hypothetical protein [Klebsormidium flaccidum]
MTFDWLLICGGDAGNGQSSIWSEEPHFLKVWSEEPHFLKVWSEEPHFLKLKVWSEEPHFLKLKVWSEEPHFLKLKVWISFSFKEMIEEAERGVAFNPKKG